MVVPRFWDPRSPSEIVAPLQARFFNVPAVHVGECRRVGVGAAVTSSLSSTVGFTRPGRPRPAAVRVPDDNGFDGGFGGPAGHDSRYVTAPD